MSAKRDLTLLAPGWAEYAEFLGCPKVNLGPLPGEGRGENPPPLSNSQSLQGVNYH